MLLKGFTKLYSVILNNYLIFLFLLFISFLLIFFCSQFSYLFGDFNIWTDVNIYYTIGKGIWFEKVPYKDLFDHKGPIIFFLYAIGYGLSPNSFQGMFFIEGLFLFISLVSVFLLSRLYFNKSISLLSSCIYGLCIFSFTAFGGSAEEFILSLMIVSLFFFFKFFKEKTLLHPPFYMFLHGVLLSVTFFIKLNLVVFWFSPLLFIFMNLLYNQEYQYFIKNTIAVFAGILFVSVPIFMYFILNNALDEFIEGYFHVNFIYGSAYTSTPFELLKRTSIIFYKLLRTEYLPIFFILLGLLYFTFSNLLKNRVGRISIVLSLFSIVYVVFLGEKFMSYYFLACLFFVPIGILSAFSIVNKIVNVDNRYLILVFSIFTFFCLTLSIKSKNFFGSDFRNLVSQDRDLGFIDTFSNILDKDSDRSFICIGLHYSIDVFTRSKTVPTERYFFIPNIYPDRYPIIYDSQLGYIKSNSIKYLIMRDDYPLKSIFYDTILRSGYIPIAKNEGFTLYQYKR